MDELPEPEFNSTPQGTRRKFIAKPEELTTRNHDQMKYW